MTDKITTEEYQRYARMISLPEMGEEAVRELKQSEVLVFGAGGLGSTVIPALSAMGIGHLGINEFDQVEYSNLQRQLLYSPEDQGKLKSELAKKEAERLNPQITVTSHGNKCSESNCQDLITAYDLIIDCTDNFQTRYLINDTCAKLSKPLIYGSVNDYKGLVSLLHSHKNVDLRDIFPEVPEDKAAKGIIPTLPMIIGSMQANEALKLLTGTGETLDGKLLSYNALTNEQYVLQL